MRSIQTCSTTRLLVNAACDSDVSTRTAERGADVTLEAVRELLVVRAPVRRVRRLRASRTRESATLTKQI